MYIYICVCCDITIIYIFIFEFFECSYAGRKNPHAIIPLRWRCSPCFCANFALRASALDSGKRCSRKRKSRATRWQACLSSIATKACRFDRASLDKWNACRHAMHSNTRALWFLFLRERSRESCGFPFCSLCRRQCHSTNTGDSRWKLKGNPLTHRAEPMQITRLGPYPVVALFNRLRTTWKASVSFVSRMKVSRELVNGIEWRGLINFDYVVDFCHTSYHGKDII